MEIFGTVVSMADNRPVAGAVVTRLYPNGGRYDVDIIADQYGNFNGRVEDRTYSWVVSAPGYFPAEVSLADALHNEPMQPKIVKLSPFVVSPQAAPVVETVEEPKANTLLWVGVIVGGAIVFHKPLKKIFNG